MSDVVVELPVSAGEEDLLFGAFVSQFIDGHLAEAERLACVSDGPYLMIRSNPTLDGEVKRVIFQGAGPARAFSAGWQRLKRKRTNLPQA